MQITSKSTHILNDENFSELCFKNIWSFEFKRLKVIFRFIGPWYNVHSCRNWWQLEAQWYSIISFVNREVVKSSPIRAMAASNLICKIHLKAFIYYAWAWLKILIPALIYPIFCGLVVVSIYYAIADENFD